MNNKILILISMIISGTMHAQTVPTEISYLEMSQIIGGANINTCGSATYGGSKVTCVNGSPLVEQCSGTIEVCRDSKTAYSCGAPKKPEDCDICNPKKRAFHCNMVTGEWEINFWGDCVSKGTLKIAKNWCYSFKGVKFPTSTCK